jgi:hypothetical protein
MSVSLESEPAFYFMTYGMLHIDQRSVLMYLLQLILEECLSKLKIIGAADNRHIG